MSAIHTIQTDLAWLRQEPQLGIDDVIQLMERKKGYKTLPEYGAFKDELRKVRMQKLPFRIELLANEAWKKGQHTVQDFPKPTPDKRKEAKRQLRAKLIQDAKQNEPLLQTLEKVCCLHGTNSAILALAPKMLQPTGALLDQGIGPMSGEIQRGTSLRGINQVRISCVTIKSLPICISYATQISHSFTPPQNPEDKFCKLLALLEQITPDSDEWDAILIGFYHIKQWSPEIFEKLKQQYAERIAKAGLGCNKEQKILDVLDVDLKKIQKEKSALDAFLTEYHLEGTRWNHCNATYESVSYFLRPQSNFDHDLSIGNCDAVIFEVMRLKSHGEEQIKILFNEDGASDKFKSCYQQEFRKVMQDSRDVEEFLKRKVRPIVEARLLKWAETYTRHYARKERLFEEPCKIQLSAQDREYLQRPFPLVVASKTVKPEQFGVGDEYLVSSLSWGDEIDTVFTLEKDKDTMNAWLQRQGLIGRVQVLSIEALQSLNTKLLRHAPDQVR